MDREMLECLQRTRALLEWVTRWLSFLIKTNWKIMHKINEYAKWADIVKGIGIVAVVVGHSGSAQISQYVYWFHMPLFFIMSGYFFKPVVSPKEMPSLIRKYGRRLLVPYLSFLIFITVIRYTYLHSEGSISSQWLRQDVRILLLGGRLLRGWYGPFWFVTTLFFTYIAFASILLYVKQKKRQLIIILILYLAAHFESWLNLRYNFIVPLNVDVTLISLSYFSFGYYAKGVLSNLPRSLFLMSSLSTAALYLGGFSGKFNYKLNLKNIGYSHILLDFLIPVVITISIIGLAQIIEKYSISDVLAYFGKQTMPIMYLHLIPNILLQPILGYGSMVYVIIGLVFPLLVTTLFLKRSRVTRILFLGAPLPIE